MSFEEMVVALAGAVGGIALVGFIFAKIVGLIKVWINRNNTYISEEDFDRLAQAFIEYRKNSDRRIQNLEAIIAEENNTTSQQLSDRVGRQGKSSNASETIEIEDEEQRTSSAGNNSNLRNMLHK